MRRQSGIPIKQVQKGASRANGIKLRGVVLTTYVTDDATHPQAENAPVGVYCDVLVYSSKMTFRAQILQQVMVRQDRGGIHSGEVWKPRATTVNVTNNPIDTRGTNPANLDGDHVLIEFLEDNLNMPIITGGVPHPMSDIGNTNKAIGHRMRLKVADGNPRFWKHHGTFFGVDPLGNFVVDLTEANDGVLTATGAEAPAPTDGTKGNMNVKLPTGSKITVTLNNQPLAVLELSGATSKFTLGNGAVHATIYEALETFWNTVVKPKFDAFDGHLHPTGVGPSGVPAPLVAFPTFDTAIKSLKISFPNG